MPDGGLRTCTQFAPSVLAYEQVLQASLWELLEFHLYGLHTHGRRREADLVPPLTGSVRIMRKLISMAMWGDITRYDYTEPSKALAPTRDTNLCISFYGAL